MSRKKRLQRERELERERRSGVRTKYLPRSFLWNVLAVMLAFLIGLFSALAGLLGVGFFFLTKPAKTVIPNYQNFLREDYGEKSLIDLTGELSSLIQQIAGAGGSLTLDMIGKYTPLIENLLTPLTESLGGIGVPIDLATFMSTPLSGIGSYFQNDVLNSIVLGEVLNLNSEANALLLSICYGTEGVDYTFAEDGSVQHIEGGKEPLTIGGLSGIQGSIVSDLTIEAALNVTPTSNAAMRYLAYGTEGTNYEIRDGEVVMLVNPLTGEPFRKKTIADLTAENASAIDDAKISDLIDTGTESTGIMAAIRDWKISDLRQQSRIERLKIRQVVDLSSSTSEMMKAIADWRIKDLTDQNKINSLTLGDVLTINAESPKLLQTLKTVQIGELGEKMNTLRLYDILGTEDINGNKLLRNLGKSTLNSLASGIGKLSVWDVFGSEMYCYMPIVDGKTYKDFLNQYDPKAEDSEARKQPVSITPDEGTEAVYTTRYRYIKGGEKQDLVYGWLAEENGTFKPYAEDDVHTDSKGSYAEKEIDVTPVYKYMRIDFNQGGTLVEAEYTAEKKDGWTNGNVYGEADETNEEHESLYVRGEDGQILYYYPAEEAAPGEDAAPVVQYYYPLMRDDFGIYCLTPTMDGRRNRIDFEESVTGYKVSGGETLEVGDKGGAMYAGEEKLLHLRKGEDGSVTGKYILARVDVQKAYYEESDPNINTLEGGGISAESVETYYWGTWTEGEEPHESEVDRYLDGIWYVLLGGTEYDEDGNVSEIIDDSNTPILDISGRITATAATISDIPLWELYLHGLITVDPYKDLGPVTAHNLNELTIAKVIEYAKDPIHYSWGS